MTACPQNIIAYRVVKEGGSHGRGKHFGNLWIGLMIGAFIGLKYLLGELEKFPSKAAFVPSTTPGEKSLDWKSVQPITGVLVILGLVLWAYGYAGRACTEIGDLLLFGAAFGIVLQRCRFCFVRAFRNPFMTGEAGIAKCFCGVPVGVRNWAGPFFYRTFLAGAAACSSLQGSFYCGIF
jgi:hypothetical protein